MESGSCAATSCFKVATLYSPGETSPGIISGKWKVDLGWSISFKDSCHSEDAISTCSIIKGVKVVKIERRTGCLPITETISVIVNI